MTEPAKALDQLELTLIERGFTRGDSWAAAPWGHTRDLPRQAIKLHVSATVASANEVVERVLPVLRANDVHCKVAADTNVVRSLNSGRSGATQVGKVVTAYPRCADTALRVARELDQVTRGLPGPRVPSDMEAMPGSLVHYRYGVLRADDAEYDQLVRPDGSRTPDARDPATPVPEWIIDPFRREGEQRDRSIWASRRFIVHEVLRARPRGPVVRAVLLGDAPRAVIVKEGLRDGEALDDGWAGPQLVARQAQVLQAFARDPRFVDVIEEHLVEGDRTLVMEDAAARTVDEELVVGDMCAEDARHVMAQATTLVRDLHAAGWAWTDLSPDNLLVDRSGSEVLVRVCDLEHAVRIDGSEPVRGGTPGYAPRCRTHVANHDHVALMALAARLANAASASSLADPPRPTRGG